MIVRQTYEFYSGSQQALESVNQRYSAPAYQRKLAIGTDWTDIVMAVCCGISPDTDANQLSGNYGFLLGFGSSDGGLFNDDQTIFVGAQKALPQPGTYWRYNGTHLSITPTYSPYDDLNAVTKAGPTLTVLDTILGGPGVSSQVGTITLIKSDGSSYSGGRRYDWFVVRFVKGAAGAAKLYYASTSHDYAPNPSRDGMATTLQTKSMTSVGIALMGVAYGPPYYQEMTTLTVPDQDKLDSVCFAMDWADSFFQVHDVLVSKWA